MQGNAAFRRKTGPRERESPRHERHHSSSNGHLSPVANGHPSPSVTANGHASTSPVTANGHRSLSPLSASTRSPPVCSPPGRSPRSQFARLRDELSEVSSREGKMSLIANFVLALPPYYQDAAKHFMAARSSAGVPVNIDDLAAHFAMLDQTAAMALPPPGHRDGYANGHSLASPATSPFALPSPTDAVRPLPPRDDETPDEMKGFAPSRPMLANLLSPSPDDERPGASGGGKQELR